MPPFHWALPFRWVNGWAFGPSIAATVAKKLPQPPRGLRKPLAAATIAGFQALLRQQVLACFFLCHHPWVDKAHNFWYSMGEIERKLDAVFFRTDTGSEPVREWLLSLAKGERKIIGGDVLKVQHCWPVGKPLVGNLGAGLWEVRSRLRDGVARVIFCVEGPTMVLLHGFIKKTRKTPRRELDLAVKRMNQLR